MCAAPRPRSRERELRSFYEKIAGFGLAPLWEVIRQLLGREPTTDARARLWAYDELRPLLLEAGDLISAEEAERRVLVLENPGLPGTSSISETLYAGLQLILPGEVAPAHRHTPAAIRFVLEGSGAWTAVDGERAPMEPGDLILTPSWTWHDHAHDGAGPVIWLVVLDVPLLRYLGPRFTEDYPESQFPEKRAPAGASPAFRFAYAAARRALDGLAELDPHLGYLREYRNPQDGGPVLRTLSTFLRRLPSGFRGRHYRATDAAVYSVVEGRGRTRIGAGEGAVTLEWGPRDHFVVPRWQPHAHECDEEAVLFHASDRVVQERLGLWREARDSS